VTAASLLLAGLLLAVALWLRSGDGSHFVIRTAFPPPITVATPPDDLAAARQAAAAGDHAALAAQLDAIPDTSLDWRSPAYTALWDRWADGVQADLDRHTTTNSAEKERDKAALQLRIIQTPYVSEQRRQKARFTFAWLDPAASERLAEEEVAAHPRDRTRIKALIRKYSWTCYYQGQRQNYDMEGTVDYSFTVDPGGATKDIKVLVSGSLTDAVAACTRKSFGKLRFPVPEDGQPELVSGNFKYVVEGKGK
jgi:hypothetical protein